LGSEAKKACQPLDKKVGKVMALRGDGLSYLADWPLGMSPASAVAIVRGDGVGSNATAAARPALPGLAGDRGTITVVPEAPALARRQRYRSVPYQDQLASQTIVIPPQQRDRNLISDKRLMFFVGNLSVFYGLLPGSYIISR